VEVFSQENSLAVHRGLLGYVHASDADLNDGAHLPDASHDTGMVVLGALVLAPQIGMSVELQDRHAGVFPRVCLHGTDADRMLAPKTTTNLSLARWLLTLRSTALTIFPTSGPLSTGSSVKIPSWYTCESVSISYSSCSPRPDNRLGSFVGALHVGARPIIRHGDDDDFGGIGTVTFGGQTPKLVASIMVLLQYRPAARTLAGVRSLSESPHAEAPCGQPTGGSENQYGKKPELLLKRNMAMATVVVQRSFWPLAVCVMFEVRMIRPLDR